MKPIPPMPAVLILAFVAALIACQLALISDLLLVTIILALLIVLVATEPEPGECRQPRTTSASFLSTSFTVDSPAASGIFAASRRRASSSSRRRAFSAPADTSRGCQADAGSGAAAAQLTAAGTF